MLVFLIMLIIIMEVIFTGFIVLTLAKTSSKIEKTNNEITKIKKSIIPAFIECRVAIRMANIESKNLITEQKNKQLFDFINLLGAASFLLGMKKKKIL